MRGTGDKAFVGGADVSEMAVISSPAAARAFIESVHQAYQALRDLPVPVIARIDGYALGAGLELAAACDLRIASTRSRFGMPEVRVGVPSVIEAALLPGLIGWGRARQLLLLGEPIGAEEAHAWGLVEKVVTAADLDAAVEAWLQHIDASGPHAVRRQKALIREWEALGLDQAIEAGVSAFGEAWETDEPSRMMKAFIARPRK